MLWQAIKETACECYHLLIRNPEELANSFKECVQDEPERMKIAKRDESSFTTLLLLIRLKPTALGFQSRKRERKKNGRS